MKVKKAKKGFSPTKLTLSVAAALAAIGSAPATVLAQSAPRQQRPKVRPRQQRPTNWKRS